MDEKIKKILAKWAAGSKITSLEWQLISDPKTLELNELAVSQSKKPFPKSITKEISKNNKEFDKFLLGLDYFLSFTKKNKITDFIVIKLKKFPKPHTDLDILTTKENSKKIVDLLIKEGFSIKDQMGYEVGLRKKISGRDFVVDIHCDISYNNGDFLDSLKIMARKTMISYHGRRLPYSSAEDDFIITLVHAFFQKVAVRRQKGFNRLKWSEITLSDLFQLSEDSKSKNFNWKYVRKTAEKYGWVPALNYSILAINEAFPSPHLKKQIQIIPLSQKKRFLKDISSQGYPIFTSIPLTYGICFSKFVSEMKRSPMAGVKYFFNMHKWFTLNGIRVLYYWAKG